uniref:Uncharacterized protein n=1 Tax=viral metagenome TaxID=1070528 RepID=A0A6C0ATA9_9ZZZZ
MKLFRNFDNKRVLIIAILISTILCVTTYHFAKPFYILEGATTNTSNTSNTTRTTKTTNKKNSSNAGTIILWIFIFILIILALLVLGPSVLFFIR